GSDRTRLTRRMPRQRNDARPAVSSGAEMSRYKGRASAKEIEKDFPHILDMRVPLVGFGSKLNAMHRWHETRAIRAIHSPGRRDENNRDYIRWCVRPKVDYNPRRPIPSIILGLCDGPKRRVSPSFPR